MKKSGSLIVKILCIIFCIALGVIGMFICMYQYAKVHKSFKVPFKKEVIHVWQEPDV